MRTMLGLVLLPALLFGCNESHDGSDDAGPAVDSAVMCEPCEDAVQLRIQGVTDPADVTVDGVEVTCVAAASFVYCGIRTLPPGTYSLTVSAPGMTPERVFFDLGEPTSRVPGCSCPASFSRLITLHEAP